MFSSTYDAIDHLCLFMSYCTVIGHVSRLWAFIGKFQDVPCDMNLLIGDLKQCFSTAGFF
jgi:hypothetical protein